jgi:SAM-dependent methyltransferase
MTATVHDARHQSPETFSSSAAPRAVDTRAKVLLGIAADAGVPIRPGLRVLDFGCGKGALVRDMLDRGLTASGADILAEWNDTDLDLRQIETPYRLPFPDASFDLVLSNQVLEHVANIEDAFREIARVLAPGGVSVHIYPSGWRLIESHIYVPGSSMVQTSWWLAIWAMLGVRNEYQRGKGWREVVALNRRYCDNHLHYRFPLTTRSIALKFFQEVTFPIRYFVRHSPGRLARLSRAGIPGMGLAIFLCREQFLLTRAHTTARRV